MKFHKVKNDLERVCFQKEANLNLAHSRFRIARIQAWFVLGMHWTDSGQFYPLNLKLRSCLLTMPNTFLFENIYLVFINIILKNIIFLNISKRYCLIKYVSIMNLYQEFLWFCVSTYIRFVLYPILVSVSCNIDKHSKMSNFHNL